MYSTVALGTRPVRCAASASRPRQAAGINRRAFLGGIFKVTAASASLLGSMDAAAELPLGRTLSSAQLARQGSLQRASSSLERGRSLSMEKELQRASNILPLKRGSPFSAALDAPTAPASILPTPPRVLELQSPQDLRGLVASHTRRLLVISIAANASPLPGLLGGGDAAAAAAPPLDAAAARFPGALFARLALAGATNDVADEALEMLGISSLPCTLAMWGKQLLAHVPAGGAVDEHAAAAQELHGALLAASIETRLQHADCAAPQQPCAFYV